MSWPAGAVSWDAIKSVPPPVEFVVGDHLAYQAIARNAQDGLSVFVEPFTGTGTSIYLSGYYWFVGVLAGLTGLGVSQVWNLLGMLIAAAFVALAAAWARWALPGSRAWALAVVPLLVSTLGWWSDGEWLGLYHDRTVAVWAPHVLIAMGGGEAFSMLVLFGGLLALAAALVAGGRAQLLLAALAGACAGLIFNTHAYVAIFGVFAVLATLIAHEALRARAGRWAAAWCGAVVAVVLLFAAGAPPEQPTTRLGVVVALLAAALLTRPAWIVAMWRTALAIAVPMALLAAPTALRLAGAAADGDSFFHSRQQASVDRDLGVPLDALLGYELPVWVLAAVTIVGLVRTGALTDPRRRAWLSVVVALAAIAPLLVLNDLWGVDQEPYRFLPYAALGLALTCVPWLWCAITGADMRARVAAAAASALLIATIPTTVAWAHAFATAAPLDPAPAERDAYAQVAEATGGEMTLTDTCFWPELVRVAGGPHVTTYQPGLADPAEPELVAHIRQSVLTGRTLPPLDVLRAAGVRWFVTHDACAGVPPAQVRAELGAPVRSIPLRDAHELGLPAGTAYHVYRVG